ncbi:hypothetical protein X975_16552, partial [Stegodyphus mimosarum]
MIFMENICGRIICLKMEKIVIGLKIALDIFLFLLAAWSEIGYSLFTGSSTSESILHPLKRYLYPSISSDTASKITHYLNIVTQALSYSDAMLTIATILDVKKKREKFVNETKKGFTELKNGEIKIIPFLLNLSIFTFSFVIISLSPWVGLTMRSDNRIFTTISGSTMFLGQMTIYILQYGSYIFATPARIVYFWNLPKCEKMSILKNIFCTKKGISVVLRTLANTTVMGLRFQGIGLFTNKLIFGNKQIAGTAYAAAAATSIVYRTLMTQSLNDYKTNFSKESASQQADVANVQVGTEHQNQNITGVENVFRKLLLSFLGVLIAMTFLLRTFSTPVLCTGPIDNPEENYDVKSTVLACFGLLLGGFAAFQYCKFMWSLGKAASENISKNLPNCSCFKSKSVNLTDSHNVSKNYGNKNLRPDIAGVTINSVSAV